MSCERHGYNNGVLCPACDLEYLDKIDTIERMCGAGARADEIATKVGFPVYAVVNTIRSFLDRKVEL